MISKTRVEKLKTNNLSNKRFTTYLSIGFLHSQLIRLYISICALHIDTEISKAVEKALEAPEPPSQELTKYIWAED